MTQQKTYAADLPGVIEWAMDRMGLAFDRMTPEHVTLLLKDGSELPLAGAQQGQFKAEDILKIVINHPDATEVATIDIGTRQ